MHADSSPKYKYIYRPFASKAAKKPTYDLFVAPMIDVHLPKLRVVGHSTIDSILLPRDRKRPTDHINFSWTLCVMTHCACAKILHNNQKGMASSLSNAAASGNDNAENAMETGVYYLL